MSVIDKLKQDFLPRANCLESVLVRMKGSEEEIQIFFRPVANVTQSDKYIPLMQQNKTEGYVELVITRALNEDGSKMFLPKDKSSLMRDVDPDFIVDLGNKILGVDDITAPRFEEERREIEKK